MNIFGGKDLTFSAGIELRDHILTSEVDTRAERLK